MKQPSHAGPLWPTSIGSVAALAALAATAVLLVWSRFNGLNQSFWTDEAISVLWYSSKGPAEILLGEYRINNHILFNLLAWATTRLLGESEFVFRLWSVVPSLAAIALLTWWIWRRSSPSSAAVFAFLAAIQLEYLEWTRYARGYGLVSLAMAGVIVGGDAVLRQGRRRDLALFGVSGLIGIWTFPMFVIPFALAWLVLVARPNSRRDLLVTFAAVGFLSALVLGPSTIRTLFGVASEFRDHRSLEPVSWTAAATWPFRFLGVEFAFARNRKLGGPALALYGTILIGYPLILSGAARLVRRKDESLGGLLLLPIIGTYLVPAAFGMALAPRHTVFLALPIMVMTALGWSALMSALRSYLGAALLVTLAAILGATQLVEGFMRSAELRFTAREDVKTVAEVVRTRSPEVVTTNRYSFAIQYYLPETLSLYQSQHGSRLFCASDRDIAYVAYPPSVGPQADTTCLEERGLERIRVEQRGRGGWIDVWLSPPGAQQEPPGH